MRDGVCFLANVQSIQNENEDVLLSRASLIAQTLIDYEQINTDAFETCVGLLTQTVLDYVDIVGRSTHAETFKKAFSVILEQRTLLSDAVYANVTLSLQTLMEGFQSNLAIGEAEMTIKTDNIRLLASVMTPESLANNTVYSIPRTDYEVFDGTPDETVELNTTALLTSHTSDGMVVASSISCMTNNPEACQPMRALLKFIPQPTLPW